ncbi:hypothetical protein [Streptomyces acidicola]|uniref:hypothetical protein n=1 Tax=Streptomyces acidicola TaxID=2596892 RepID=UPI003440D978
MGAEAGARRRRSSPVPGGGSSHQIGERAALSVKIDDEIGGTRWLGRPPLLTDSELVCLAWCKPCSAGTGPGTPLEQRDGEVFQVRAHAVPPAGLLGIATAATCFGVLLGRLRGRGRPGR